MVYYSQPWMDAAKCVVEEMDPGLFCLDDRTDAVFKKGPSRQREARRLCDACPVLSECARYALLEADTSAVRGGVAIPPQPKPDTVARLMFAVEHNRPPDALELADFTRDHNIPEWSRYGLDFRSEAA